MTSETPFKNLHRLESFKSTGYKLWITEWLGERETEKERERGERENLDMNTVNLYFWLSTVTTKIQNTGNTK